MKSKSIKIIEINVWKVMDRKRILNLSKQLHAFSHKQKQTYTQPQDLTKKINKRYSIYRQWMGFMKIKHKNWREREKKESISCVI